MPLHQTTASALLVLALMQDLGVSHKRGRFREAPGRLAWARGALGLWSFGLNSGPLSELRDGVGHGLLG